MLSAVIFDLDGVLADSEPWWSEIDAKLLAEHGVTYRGEYHQNVVGVSYRLAVEFYKKAFGLSVPTEEMMRRRGEIATEFFADRVDLFPNVKEVLEKLRQMKLHLAVATSSVSASARPFLDRHQLTGFFEVIVTGEEVERRQTRARHLPMRGGATWNPCRRVPCGGRCASRRRCCQSSEHARRRDSRHTLCRSRGVRKRSGLRSRQLE